VIEAVVFDLDGVLIDSEPVWEQVRRRIVASHGGQWAPDTQDRLMGMSTGEWSRYLSEDLGVRLAPAKVAETVIEAMADQYRQHLPLLPGAVETVTRIAEQWPLGLASSAPRSLIETVLDAAALRPLFATVVSTEEVARGKPAPDVYLTVAGQLGRLPRACAAVEDSSNGLRAAAAAGCQVIAVPHPKYPPAPDAIKVARLVVPSLTELTAAAIAALDSALRTASVCPAAVKRSWTWRCPGRPADPGTASSPRTTRRACRTAWRRPPV
jgi:HAD superfamily hydrolase (TIGR01509 family)